MSNWSSYQFTRKGEQLRAKVEAGKCKLTLTKIKIGNGNVALSDIKDMSDLKSPQLILGISSCAVSAEDDRVCEVIGIASSSNVENAFSVTEMGLYANDPDVGEILYLVEIDTSPDDMPNKNAQSPVTLTYQIELVTSNTANVTAMVSPAGLITVKMMSAHRTAAELDHPDGSVTTPKLRDAAVTGAKIANKAIGKEHLKDGVVDDKAPIASPALTGTPTVPTASKGTSTDQIASTAFVAQAIADAVLAIAGHETPTITALIDWELMATENNGVDARNLWNAESGIKACGGDNTSKSGYGKSCILLKQVYTDFDKILVIGCDDACTVCTRRVFNKWELDLMFANSFIFNIVDDNGAIWRIFGGKKGTYTGELSAGKVWRTHSQGCGIIEIYSIKY